MDVLANLKEKLANNKEIIFKIKVFAGASQDAIRGLSTDGRLKVDVAAPPTDNKANQSLIRFLAKLLGIRKYQVQIVSGQNDRLKSIRISR